MIEPITPLSKNTTNQGTTLASNFVERAKAQEESFSKTVAEDELYSMVLIMPDGSLISVENLGYEDPDMVVIEGVNEGNQKLRLLVQMFGLHLILVKYKKDPEHPDDTLANKIVGYQLHRKDNSKQ